MHIAFRLLNDKSRRFLNKIIKCQEVDLVCIADANDQKWGTIDYESGVSIVSPYKVLQMYKNGEIDKVVFSPYLGVKIAKDALNEMVEMGIEKDDLLLPAIPDIESKDKLELNDFYTFLFDNNKTLSRLQFHIADHCNMNCTSCSHYSSLVNEPTFIGVDEIEHDLLSLKRIVKHIDRIDILGGEPFLNTDWKKYVESIRKVYEYTAITIITNGTLFKKMSEGDWDFIRDNDVVYRMSLYPPFWKDADKIAKFLKENEIKYELNNRVITSFAPVFLKNEKHDYVEKRKSCNAGCNQMWHGKIAPCNQMMYVSYFNKYFDSNMPDEVPIEDIDTIIDFKELETKLEQPMKICGLCNSQGPLQAISKWKQMNPGGRKCNSIDEWMY